MKRLHFHSFRQRLNAAFLAVSLAPLLLCSALLLQIFRFRMTADQQQNAQQQLSSACHALNTMQDGILSAAESLQRDGLVTRALAGTQEDSAKVYSSLYTATAAVRSTARFDLYSADGTLLYSTQAAPGEAARPVPTTLAFLSAAASNVGCSRESRLFGSIMATASFSVIMPSSTRSQAIFIAAAAVRLPLRVCSM